MTVLQQSSRRRAKGGAVVSHIRLASDREALGATNIGPGGADLYLSGDIFQAANASHLAKAQPGRTIAAVDRAITPTAAMRQTGQAAPQLTAMQEVIVERIGAERVVFLDSAHISELVFSENILANVMLLGAAFQLGGLPLSLAVLEAGLGQRKASAQANREAFEWGRWAVYDSAAVAAALATVTPDEPTLSAFQPSARALAQAQELLAEHTLPSVLASRVQRRTAQVIDYQRVALARRFVALVARALACDSAEHAWQLTHAVTESWFKLLTYKDEYEVARLHAATPYDRIARQLGIVGPYQVKYHLHPPVLRRFGLQHKIAQSWLFALLFFVLRHLKWLRGSVFDVFGWDHDRRRERALLAEYRALIEESLRDRALTYEAKVAVAASAQEIKGYGAIKERSIAAWRARVAAAAGVAPLLAQAAGE